MRSLFSLLANRFLLEFPVRAKMAENLRIPHFAFSSLTTSIKIRPDNITEEILATFYETDTGTGYSLFIVRNKSH